MFVFFNKWLLGLQELLQPDSAQEKSHRWWWKVWKVLKSHKVQWTHKPPSIQHKLTPFGQMFSTHSIHPAYMQCSFFTRNHFVQEKSRTSVRCALTAARRAASWRGTWKPTAEWAKTFSRLTFMKRKNKNTDWLKFQCRFCEMPFSVASTLEKHMRKCVVGGKKPGLPPPHWAAGDQWWRW